MQTLVDPAAQQTPDNTYFSSIILSPHYSRDHTILAAGPCWVQARCSVLFASRDGGARWERLPAVRLAPVSSLLLPPAYPTDGRIFSMGSLGLQESLDGGATFHVVTPVTGSVAISPTFDGGDPRILIAGVKLWAYRADTGMTTPVSLPAIDLSVVSWTEFSPDYARDRTLFVSGYRSAQDQLRGAEHAFRCGQDNCEAIAAPAWSFIRFAPDFTRGGTAYGFMEGSLFASTDHARTFEAIGLPEAVRHSTTLTVGRDPSGKTVLYMNAFLASAGAEPRVGIYRSNDGGETWSFAEVPDFNGVARIVMTPTGHLLVSGYGPGIACSDDGGHAWGPRCAPDDLS